jgi:hypothetical protein
MWLGSTWTLRWTPARLGRGASAAWAWFSFLAPIPSSLAGPNRLVVSVRPYVVEAAPGRASWRTAKFIEEQQVDSANALP